MCDTEVECDYETYDRLVDRFSKMEYQAEEYVPDEADMDHYVEHGDGSYMDFLIWIMGQRQRKTGLCVDGSMHICGSI